MATNNPPQKDQPEQVPPALIERFLNLQSQEIELRRSEFEIRMKSNALEHDYATKALAAQSEDREKERVHKAHVAVKQYRFILIALGLVLLFMGHAISQGKSEIAMELVKAVVLLVAGGLGGYGLSKLKRTEDKEGSSGAQ